MMTRDEYVASLKNAAFSIAKQAVMNRLARELPKLFVGKSAFFFNPIAGFVVDKVLTWALLEGELGAFFLYIDFRVNKQTEAFDKAAADYHRAVQSGDKNEIARTEAILKADFKKFVHLKS